MKLWPYLASSEEVLSCLVWPSFVFDSPRDHYFAVSLLLRRQASFVQLIKRSRRKQRLFLLDKGKWALYQKIIFLNLLAGLFSLQDDQILVFDSGFRGGEEAEKGMRVWLNCSIYDFRCSERGGKIALFQVFPSSKIHPSSLLFFAGRLPSLFSIYRGNCTLGSSNTG